MIISSHHFIMNNIVKAKPEQWISYRDLRMQAIQYAPIAFSPVDQYASYADQDWQAELTRITSLPFSYYFAEDDGKLVGMCGSRLYQEPMYTHNAEVQGLFVHQDSRGTGIGRRLLEAVLQELRELGHVKNVFSEIISSQNASLKLHEELGFATVGKQESLVAYHGLYYDNFLLQLKL